MFSFLKGVRQSLTALILGSAILVVVSCKGSNNVGSPAPNDNLPTGYNSITVEELDERHFSYMDEYGDKAQTVKALWLDVEQLEDFIAQVKHKNESLGKTGSLGLRAYFTISNGKVNLALVPGNIADDNGAPTDWSREIMINDRTANDKSYIMNRFDPCPSNCGEMLCNYE